MLSFKNIFIVALLLSGGQLFAQNKTLPKIDLAEVTRIETILASDTMEGRKTFSKGIDKAADFIAAEFKKSGIKIFEKDSNYLQEFYLIRPYTMDVDVTINNKNVSRKSIFLHSTLQRLEVNKKSGFRLDSLADDKNFVKNVRALFNKNENIIVKVPAFYADNFTVIKVLSRPRVESKYSVIFVATDENIEDYSFKFFQDITGQPLKNVIGYLPGKSKKDEFVIFSAHYDHLGIGKPNAAGDSIYNGANDDAAGVTAVISLAKYFSELKNNERSIIFVAFTAEEMGGYGSQYFSGLINADKVVAMFNIEMIGTQSKWGENSAYITGFEKSNFGEILQNNLKETAFKFEPDPYPTQQLFYRSDNARLAGMGVPAHSISTAKMDEEPFYHKQGDEVSTLDLPNMAKIIEAIALSSQSIISGKDTPTRVEKN